MCDSEEVKTLSKRKQRLSLGEASKKKKEREKEGKKNIRTSVIRPNGIEWQVKLSRIRFLIFGSIPF